MSVPPKDSTPGRRDGPCFFDRFRFTLSNRPDRENRKPEALSQLYQKEEMEDGVSLEQRKVLDGSVIIFERVFPSEGQLIIWYAIFNPFLLLG